MDVTAAMPPHRFGATIDGEKQVPGIELCSEREPRPGASTSMLVLRFIGSLFLLGAVIAFTGDLSRPHRPGTPAFASIHKHWADLAPQTLAGAQKTVASRTHRVVWDPVIVSVLSVPAFVTFGALAVLCLYLGRPRRRVEIFVN